MAESGLREAGTARRKVKQAIDAAAAQIILEAYFAVR
jgi:RNase H-fold protein (predicted Holliday junction resolvase)